MPISVFNCCHIQKQLSLILLLFSVVICVISQSKYWDVSKSLEKISGDDYVLCWVNRDICHKIQCITLQCYTLLD